MSRSKNGRTSVLITVPLPPHSHDKFTRILPNLIQLVLCRCCQQNGEHVRCGSNVGALVVFEFEASPSSCFVQQTLPMRTFPEAKVPDISTDCDQHLPPTAICFFLKSRGKLLAIFKSCSPTTVDLFLAADLLNVLNFHDDPYVLNCHFKCYSLNCSRFPEQHHAEIADVVFVLQSPLFDLDNFASKLCRARWCKFVFRATDVRIPMSFFVLFFHHSMAYHSWIPASDQGLIFMFCGPSRCVSFCAARMW